MCGFAVVYILLEIELPVFVSMNNHRIGRLYKWGMPGWYIYVIHYINIHISKTVHFQDF